MSSSRRQKLRVYDFDSFGRQEISVHHCQSGFHPRSTKEIVVWTRADLRSLPFALINTESGKVAKRGACRRKGENTWGRIDWIADVSDVRLPGKYCLELRPAGGKACRSEPFTIADQCYDILLEKAAKHVHMKRCGVYCHGHDAYERSLDQKDFGRILGHRELRGGWHDGNDDDKLMATWNVIYGLCEAHDRVRPEWTGTNEPLPYALAEAWWEVEFTLKGQNDDGSFIGSVVEWKPRFVNGKWVNQMCDAGPYDDLAGDQRCIMNSWRLRDLMKYRFGTEIPPPKFPGYEGSQAHVYYAAALARFARSVAPYDRGIARRCLAGARKALAFVESQSCPAAQLLNTRSGLALAKMNLLLADGKTSADKLGQVEAHLREVLALQEPAGNFRSSPEYVGLEHQAVESSEMWYVCMFPLSYMMSLVMYLDHFPKGSMRQQVRKALRKFVEYAYPYTERTSFGYLAPLNLDGPPVVIPRGSSNARCLAAAALFLAAGRIFRDSRYLAVGEKNIHWTLGANPRAVSSMIDEGYRNIGLYRGASDRITTSSFSYYNHNRDFRWGMSTGIRGSVADIPNQPPDYPNAGDVEEFKYQHHGQECWLLVNGWFLMAATEAIAVLGGSSAK